MKYFRWLLKAVILFVLFAFALNNQQVTTVHFFFGGAWRAPMVLVVLATFALGLSVGVLGMVPRWWRLRQLLSAQKNSVQNEHNVQTPVTGESSAQAQAQDHSFSASSATLNKSTSTGSQTTAMGTNSNKASTQEEVLHGV